MSYRSTSLKTALLTIMVLKIKVDFYDHKDKFQNNFQKIILDMFRCTTPSSEDKNWLIMQLNKYEADS